jgi:DNA-binding transcriptional LysR family regulator
MTLQQLRDLVAVVTHGGFRSAARALDVSQAGLTKSLAKLEAEHGVSLIERTAKGIVLSAHGEEFLRYAQPLLQEAERAEAWLRSTRERRAESVNLGVSIEPSLRLVPAVLGDFRRAMPEVTIHVTQGVASELLLALRENRLDIAVTRVPLGFEAADLRTDMLYESEAAILGRAGHPLARARSIRELVALEWVVVGDPTRPGAEDASIKELFEEQQLGRPRFAAVSNSLFGAISMLIESDCLARLPRAVLDHPLVGPSLVAIPVREPPHRHAIAIVRKASRHQSREAQMLAAMLASFARLSRAFGHAQDEAAGLGERLIHDRPPNAA